MKKLTTTATFHHFVKEFSSKKNMNNSFNLYISKFFASPENVNMDYKEYNERRKDFFFPKIENCINFKFNFVSFKNFFQKNIASEKIEYNKTFPILEKSKIETMKENKIDYSFKIVSKKKFFFYIF